MKVKTKRAFAALLFFSLAFCSKPQTPGGNSSSGNTNPQAKSEPYVSIIFPRSSETFRKMSESEIYSKFQSLMHYVMSDPAKGEARSISELSSHVAKSVDESAYAQSIVDEFYKNGIYLAIKQDTGEEGSRYADADHALITGTKTDTLLKSILEKTNDWEAAHQAMQNIPLDGEIKTLADMVTMEDHIDPIFFPMNQLKINAYIDVNGKLDLNLLPSLNPLSWLFGGSSLSGNPGGEFEVGKTLEGETAKEALEGLITLAHFWDPDKGWNSGNTNAWGNIRLNGLNESFNLATIDLNPSLAFSIVTGITGEASATAKAYIGTKPEYILDWLRNPPSAYFKALCYWHGWTELVWKQKQDKDRICTGKVKVLGITVKTYKFACGKTWGDVKEAAPITFPGVIDHLADNDTGMAMQYLARTLHLLQDMTVPCHAHNDPHAKDEFSANLNEEIEVPEIPFVTINQEATAKLQNISFIGGGEDMWEKKIMKSGLIEKILNRDSYRFEIQTDSIKEDSFNAYSSQQSNIAAEKTMPGSFFYNVEQYSKALEGTYSLFSLFFNAAQAAQYFPTIKVKPEYNTNGLYNVPGNQKTFSDYHSLVGEFKLTGTPGLEGPSYNDTSKFDTNFTSNYSQYLAGQNSLIPSEKGTYYLVYTGEDLEEVQRFKTRDYARSKVIVDGSGMLKVTDTNYQLYYLGFPYNKMAETLLPLSVAVSSRLLRNYFRFYHQ